MSWPSAPKVSLPTSSASTCLQQKRTAPTSSGLNFVSCECQTPVPNAQSNALSSSRWADSLQTIPWSESLLFMYLWWHAESLILDIVAQAQLAVNRAGTCEIFKQFSCSQNVPSCCMDLSSSGPGAKFPCCILPHLCLAWSYADLLHTSCTHSFSPIRINSLKYLQPIFKSGEWNLTLHSRS